jgi:hypothetical protein
METLERLGAVAAAIRRFAELRLPETEWRRARALEARRLSEAAEVLAVVEEGLVWAGYLEELPSALEIVNCVERIETADATSGQTDHLEARRTLAHEWLDRLVAAAPSVYVDDTADQAHLAVDDTLAAVGNLRKPGVIAFACTVLALQDVKVDRLRAGQGGTANIYARFGSSERSEPSERGQPN